MTTKTKRKFHKYTETKISQIKEDIESGLSYRATAEKNNVARSTVHRIIKNPELGRNFGRPTVLSEDEEKLIVTAILTVQKANQPINRATVKTMVQEFITSINRETPFKDGKPGKKWMRSFFKRHSQLVLRKPEVLEVNRSKQLSRPVIDAFFDTVLLPVFDQHSLHNAPHRIFNLDETGLTGDPRHGKVIVGRGSKDVHMLTPNSVKKMTTVLVCASAFGNFLPPLVVYKGVNLQSTHCQGGPKGTRYAITKSGWMESDVFETYILKIFVEETKNLEKPVVLIYDGHNSHLTYPTIKACIENEIILICLPPHTSHALQPLDVGVFKPFKGCWKGQVATFYAQSRLQAINNQVFPTILQTTWQKIERMWAVKGFEGAGILPVDKTKALRKCVDANLEESDAEDDQEMSPRKRDRRHLSDAILRTIAPAATEQTQFALDNTKKKRKRVQAKVGEVLSTEEVAQRLAEEEEARKAKEAGSGQKRKSVGSGQKRKAARSEQEEAGSAQQRKNARGKGSAGKKTKNAAPQPDPQNAQPDEEIPQSEEAEAGSSGGGRGRGRGRGRGGGGGGGDKEGEDDQFSAQPGMNLESLKIK
jgi:hypothetical protein